MFRRFRHGQLDLGARAGCTPDVEPTTNARRPFTHALEPPVSRACSAAAIVRDHPHAVVADAQQQLVRAVDHLHLDPFSACMSHGVAKGLTPNQRDLVADGGLK